MTDGGSAEFSGESVGASQYQTIQREHFLNLLNLFPTSTFKNAQRTVKKLKEKKELNGITGGVNFKVRTDSAVGKLFTSAFINHKTPSTADKNCHKHLC